MITKTLKIDSDLFPVKTTEEVNFENVINVEDTMSGVDAFFTASNEAKKLGTEDHFGIGIVRKYVGGDSRHIWLAVSNGQWTNTVEMTVESFLMEQRMIECALGYMLNAHDKKWYNI